MSPCTGYVVIAGGMSGPVLFPVVVVPIGHAQLQTVIKFSTRLTLSGEQAYDSTGCDRVRIWRWSPALGDDEDA